MTTSTIEISRARAEFGKLQERVRSENVLIVTNRGEGAFAVMDLEYMEAMLETIEIMSNPEAYKMLQQSLEDIREGRVIDQDDLENELL